MKINLTARQVNFLAAFEAAHGRPAAVNRKTLVAFKESWTPSQVGPLGFNLRWPAWLTNSGTFTEVRGNYTLPWEAYDEWNANKGNAAKANAATVNA
jgi:hypothetical protein